MNELIAKPEILSVASMQEVAADIDDQGDRRYSHKEMRELLRQQRDDTRAKTIRLVVEWLKAHSEQQYYGVVIGAEEFEALEQLAEEEK